MNLPNKLTTFRLLAVFVMTIIYCVFGRNDSNYVIWVQYVIFGLFIIASITDFFDGYLARKLNLVTGFGKLMDPLADKLLVISAIFILLDMKIIPYWWLLLLVILRELLVLGVRLAAIEGGGKVIAASFSGKAKTFTQMISISMLLLYSALSLSIQNTFINVIYYIFLGMFYLSTLLCVISGIEVLIKNKKYFKMK